MIETIMLIVVIFVLSGVFGTAFFIRKKKAFEPAAANAGLCNRWRTGTDRNIRRKVFCS
ncbi:MAG: hypothetical protein ACLT8O_05595 [Blautia massiliensis (ex Durand et al. 2017)]